MTGFFEEKPGVKSNNRLNSSIIIYVGLLIAILIVCFGLKDFISLPISLVSIGFLQKVVGKFAEKQN